MYSLSRKILLSSSQDITGFVIPANYGKIIKPKSLVASSTSTTMEIFLWLYGTFTGGSAGTIVTLPDTNVASGLSPFITITSVAGQSTMMSMALGPLGAQIDLSFLRFPFSPNPQTFAIGTGVSASGSLDWTLVWEEVYN